MGGLFGKKPNNDEAERAAREARLNAARERARIAEQRRQQQAALRADRAVRAGVRSGFALSNAGGEGGLVSLLTRTP